MEGEIEEEREWTEEGRMEGEIEEERIEGKVREKRDNKQVYTTLQF